MNEQNFTLPIAPTYPLHQLTTLPFDVEETKKILAKHGCIIEEHPDEYSIFFPEGTTRSEIYPRTMQPLYRIKLPDGYELREIYDRHRKISILGYLLE